MENNKNHQITLPEGRIGFSSLDVVVWDEPKYQTRSTYELTNAIISTDERYNDCFSYTQNFQLRAAKNFYRSSMNLKIQSSNNLNQSDTACRRTLEWVKGLPTSYPTESLVLDRHAARQNCKTFQATSLRFSGIQQENVISTTSLLKKGFAINPAYRRCLKH